MIELKGTAMLCTGLGLYRSFSYITIMNDRGKTISQKKFPSNVEIAEFLKEVKMETSVLELQN